MKKSSSVKRAWKIIAPLAIVMAIAGAALFGGGLALGGPATVVWADGLQVVHRQIMTKELPDFNRVEVISHAVGVTIRPGNINSIEVTTTGVASMDPTWSVTDGTLTVNQPSQNTVQFSVLDLTPSIVTITYAAPPSEVRVDSHTGSISVTGDIPTVLLSTDTGDISRQGTTSDLTIESHTGRTEITGDTTNLSVDANTGVVDFQGATAEAHVQVTTGDIRLVVKANPARCSWSLTTSTGGISADGDDSATARSHQVADAERAITASTTTGSIDLSFVQS